MSMHPAETLSGPMTPAVPPLLDAERLVRPGHFRYDDARAVWNGRIDRRPDLIVQAVTADDVVWAVQTARRERLSLAVRGA